MTGCGKKPLHNIPGQAERLLLASPVLPVNAPQREMNIFIPRRVSMVIEAVYATNGGEPAANSGGLADRRSGAIGSPLV